MDETKGAMKTTVPGPKAQKILDRVGKNIPRGVAFSVNSIVKEASGALLKDIDGNIFIDFAGGIGVLNVGHCPVEVVEAVQEQAGKLIHTCFQVIPYEGYIALAEKLNQITPGDFAKKTFFINAGAEAVENAIKIARRYKNRPGIISLEAAFHGRTLMTMSLTSKVKPYKYGYGPMAPETYKIPTPYCYRCQYGLKYPNCGMECAKHIERFFVTEAEAEKMAALIIEPLQGEGGFIVPPPEYLRTLKALCEKYDVLFIFDEIQTGFGRTGKLFAAEHSGVVPDIMTMAKSIAAGVPLSAVTGRAEIMDTVGPGEIGTTYGGNPMACAAALKVLEIVERDNLAARAQVIGDVFMGRMHQWQKTIEMIGDVRGLGAMVAMEIVKDRKTKEPAPEEAKQVVAKCAQNGLIGLMAGIYGNVIRFLVPLVITDEQLEQGLDILGDAVEKVLR